MGPGRVGRRGGVVMAVAGSCEQIKSNKRNLAKCKNTHELIQKCVYLDEKFTIVPDVSVT